MKNCWQQNRGKECKTKRCNCCKNINWIICEDPCCNICKNPCCDSQDDGYHAVSATEFISPIIDQYGLYKQRIFQGYITAEDEHVIMLPSNIVLPDDTQFPLPFLNIQSTLFFEARTQTLTAEDFKIENDRVTLIMPRRVTNGYYHFSLIWDLKKP